MGNAVLGALASSPAYVSRVQAGSIVWVENGVQISRTMQHTDNFNTGRYFPIQ